MEGDEEKGSTNDENGDAEEEDDADENLSEGVEALLERSPRMLRARDRRRDLTGLGLLTNHHDDSYEKMRKR